MRASTRSVSMGVVLCLAILAGCQTAKIDQTKTSVNPDGELVLAKAGVSLAPIIIPEHAPPFTRRAADELAGYLEKISGAKPEVIAGVPDPLPEHAIWVGIQPVLEKIFPEIDFNFEYPEEILIAADKTHLVICGRDLWLSENPDPNDRSEAGETIQSEFGTANAVYTFLQDFLETRWFWPGELGEDVIKRETIAFSPFQYQYHPQIRSRGGIFNYSRLGRDRGYGRSQDWARRQRLQLDSLVVGGGHGFGDWWNRFHLEHPEYFALQPNGTRAGGDKPFPGERTVKMCKSNPGLWNQWLAEVAARLEKNPTQTVFDASANDSWASGYCVCDSCCSWDHPDGELRVFRWQGVAQDYVAMSDRQVTLANTLARKLKEKYPDKDYLVKIMAYGHSRPAPVAAVPDDNVLVVSVANFFTRPENADRGSPRGTMHREQFESWGRVAPNLFWRPNKSRKMASMPIIPTKQTIKDVQFVAENHCVGVYIDMIWEHWATRGPLYYVLAQLAWNPRQDGEAMLADYYQRGFGAAADSIRVYWDLMEETCERTWEKNYDYPELFDAKFFEKAYALLEQAERDVKNEPPKFIERVKFVRMGLDYTRMLTEAREMMLKFQADGDKDAENRAWSIWVEEIKPLANDEKYPHAINWGPARPGHGHRSSGCAPKDLVGKRW